MDDESGESMEPMEKSLTVVHSSLQRRPMPSYAVIVSLQKPKNAASVTYLKPRSHRTNWTGLYTTKPTKLYTAQFATRSFIGHREDGGKKTESVHVITDLPTKLI